MSPPGRNGETNQPWTTIHKKGETGTMSAKLGNPQTYRGHSAFRRRKTWYGHLSYGVRASGEGHYAFRSLAEWRRSVDAWWAFADEFRAGRAVVDNHNAALLRIRLGM